MGNILFGCCHFNSSLLFIDNNNKIVVNKYKLPLNLAVKYSKQKNLEFLYKENNIFKYSLNDYNKIKIIPVIFSIKDENSNELLERFINYDTVPIWIILYNEKIVTNYLNITFIKKSKKTVNFNLNENKYLTLGDLLKNY